MIDNNGDFESITNLMWVYLTIDTMIAIDISHQSMMILILELPVTGFWGVPNWII